MASDFSSAAAARPAASTAGDTAIDSPVASLSDSATPGAPATASRSTSEPAFRQEVPPPAEAFLAWPATRIAAALQTGELSSREVVEAHVRRVQETHPALNALVVPLFDEARREAALADDARARGESLGPLHGLPITIKESIDVAGTPSSMGVPRRAKTLAARDNPIVARLRRAGAVVLGKSNLAQFVTTYHSSNPVYGATNNPWRLERSSGGSSGGEAALVASGGTPLGLGNDGGGSLRQPAHACGVCTIKPTAGRFTAARQAKHHNFPPNAFQAGPIARTVGDLELFLRSFPTSSGARDWSMCPVPIGRSGDVDLARLRVAVYDDDGYFRAAPAVRRVVREAADELASAGCELVEFRPPEIEDVMGSLAAIFYADALDRFRRELGPRENERQVGGMIRNSKCPTFLRPLIFPILQWLDQAHTVRTARWLMNRRIGVARFWDHVEFQHNYADRFLQTLDEQRIDAILCPPHGLPAMRHDSLMGLMAAGSYSMFFNFVGLPAGVAPFGRVRASEESDRPTVRDWIERDAQKNERGTTGLPVGVQIAALPWREDVVLALLGELERRRSDSPEYPKLVAR